jgi:hypothetical protein
MDRTALIWAWTAMAVYVLFTILGLIQLGGF